MHRSRLEDLGIVRVRRAGMEAHDTAWKALQLACWNSDSADGLSIVVADGGGRRGIFRE